MMQPETIKFKNKCSSIFRHGSFLNSFWMTCRIYSVDIKYPSNISVNFEKYKSYLSKMYSPASQYQQYKYIKLH